MSRTPLAFMSYVNEDDKYANGKITKFREHLSRAVKAHRGKPFEIFQDKDDIKWGQQWQERINDALDATLFLIPIITPSFFNSTACREELERFLEREKELGRNDLILPVYYIECPVLKDANDTLAQNIAGHQYTDWRDLRDDSFTTRKVRKALAKLAQQIIEALERSEAESARAEVARKTDAAKEIPLPQEAKKDSKESASTANTFQSGGSPQSAAGAASSSGWAMWPDEETNGTSGWTQTENKPFYFLAQPPDGEVFDKIEYKVGKYQLVGTVKRTRTDTLKFQNGQKTGQLTFYPDRVVSKYWHEAAQPNHSINGRTVTVNHDDPQFVLTVTYEFSALQFRFSVPAKGLAEGKSYEVLFDLYSK